MRLTLIAAVAVLAACAPRGIATAQEVPARWGAYTAELVDESGRALPMFEHRGRTYVLGSIGQRYLVRIRNGSGRRVEVVASVDGRDVVDGRPASFEKRGYVVAPYGELTVDGYRLSQAAVAAFRFSSVPRSYAARKGDARDVGVVGVAVFPERVRAVAKRDAAPPPLAGAPAPAPEANASGERSAQDSSRPHANRPGLGTEFGEEHESRVEQVSFVRASARPEAVLTLRYDDRPGLVALGIDVDGDRWARRGEGWLRETATPFRTERGYCEPPPGWSVR